MDTIPFHWDTPDALQCPRMACLCPDECHEGWLCSKLLCFIYLLATGSAAYHFSQRRSRHRRRNKCPPAAKGQALRGASLKALLALDFCLGMRGHSCNSFIQMISAGLLVNFIEVRIFSVVVHANHLTVETLPQILVVMVPHAGPLISAAPDSQGIATDICSGILTVR